MNSYLNFNNWAYQYYLDRNLSFSIGTLAIEVNEIEKYCDEFKCDLKFREIISFDWSKLLQQNANDKPKYFGLIALQCYAASKMQNDGIASAADYQTRFIEVSGISTIQELQNKFRELFLNLPVQEQIWITAQKHFESKNIEIIIPDQRTRSGKYVQYPKKQVVLNQEDLKEYVDYFRLLQNTFDTVSFDNFKRHYKNNIFDFHILRKNNIRTDRIESENSIKLKQIFDFYCSENWKEQRNLFKNDLVKNKESRYILFYNEFAETKIQLYNGHDNSIAITKEIFQKSRIKGIVFFKKSEDYEKEFDSVNYLENDIEYIFVSNNDLNSNGLKILNCYFETITFDLENYCFFKGKIDINRVPEVFRQLINDSYPIELIGIKISRKREYLINFPPTIKNSKNVNFRIQPDYDSVNTRVGEYQIRVPGFSNFNFEIIENPKLNQLISSRNMGLKIQDLSLVTKGFDAQGLEYFLKYGDENKFELNINNWIKVQTRKNKKKSSNIILKAINQSKNGR